MGPERFFEDAAMMDRRTEPDGYGHFVFTYTEGAHFRAGFSANGSQEMLRAYAEGLKTQYTIVTGELDALRQGDVVKRLRDGKLLRVTSDGGDMTPPRVSSMRFAQVTAEAVTFAQLITEEARQ